MNKAGAKIRIKGFVQGVGFRYFCYRRANDLEINGWVVNMPDGSVSVMAEGDQDSVAEFIDQLKLGPGSASVSGVEVEWQEFTGKYHNFDIRH